MNRTLLFSTMAVLTALAGFSACSRSSSGPGPVTQQPAPPGPPAPAPTTPTEPPLTAAPRANCGPGSRPETGIQGRVSKEDHDSGRAAEGYTCNTELVGSYTKPNAVGNVAGFKVERYVDAAGHECAYYDTTALYPSNVFGMEAGVNVLDMSDPSKPVLTERLLTPAMQSPHESLVLSQKRGLLVAVLSTLASGPPGDIDVYDLTQDCRHPALKAAAPVGVLGHESGMAPDGLTFYVASFTAPTVTAVDISNSSLPLPLAVANFRSHGLSISDDGNRAYVAAAGADKGLVILDTSEVQARMPNATMRIISRLKWTSISTPQNAIPVTIAGHPYVVEIDEFVEGLNDTGAARIIDIGDELNPKVISNLRLEVHQPENFAAQAKDPGNTDPEGTTGFQGYAGHYCNVPRRKDPGIVACSMLLSGLRVFDIRDPFKPRELAYFNAPVKPGVESNNANQAFSSPSFVPERREIWYSDTNSGFYAVRVTNGAWPVTD